MLVDSFQVTSFVERTRCHVVVLDNTSAVVRSKALQISDIGEGRRLRIELLDLAHEVFSLAVNIFEDLFANRLGRLVKADLLYFQLLEGFGSLFCQYFVRLDLIVCCGRKKQALMLQL